MSIIVFVSMVHFCRACKKGNPPMEQPSKMPKIQKIRPQKLTPQWCEAPGSVKAPFKVSETPLGHETRKKSLNSGQIGKRLQCTPDSAGRKIPFFAGSASSDAMSRAGLAGVGGAGSAAMGEVLLVGGHSAGAVKARGALPGLGTSGPELTSSLLNRERASTSCTANGGGCRVPGKEPIRWN